MRKKIRWEALTNADMGGDLQNQCIADPRAFFHHVLCVCALHSHLPAHLSKLLCLSIYHCSTYSSMLGRRWANTPIDMVLLVCYLIR